MNELIKTITRDDGRIAVGGRGLHDFLEVGKDFSPFLAKTLNGGRYKKWVYRIFPTNLKEAI